MEIKKVEKLVDSLNYLRTCYSQKRTCYSQTVFKTSIKSWISFDKKAWSH